MKITDETPIGNAINIFVDRLTSEIEEYRNTNFPNLPKTERVEVRTGQKYAKLIGDRSIWGFIALKNGVNKGVVVEKGDILKAAGWVSPAKWTRGNIYENPKLGVHYSIYGPNYRL